MSFSDSYIPKSQVRFWLGMGIILFVLLSLCSCSFALISRADIAEYHGLFQTYRAHVVPAVEEYAEKVGRLGDNLERILDGWEGVSGKKETD